MRKAGLQRKKSLTSYYLRIEEQKITKGERWVRRDAWLPLLLNWVYDNDRTFEFLLKMGVVVHILLCSWIVMKAKKNESYRSVLYMLGAQRNDRCVQAS